MPKSSRSQIRAARRASEIAKQKRQMSRLSAHMNMDNQLFSSNDELNTNCCDEEKTEKVVETIIELPEGKEFTIHAEREEGEFKSLHIKEKEKSKSCDNCFKLKQTIKALRRKILHIQALTTKKPKERRRYDIYTDMKIVWKTDSLLAVKRRDKTQYYMKIGVPRKVSKRKASGDCWSEYMHKLLQIASGSIQDNEMAMVLSNYIKQHRSLAEIAISEASMKLFKKLDVETSVKLKQEMDWSSWKMRKFRKLLSERGIKNFLASEKAMSEYERTRPRQPRKPLELESTHYTDVNTVHQSNEAVKSSCTYCPPQMPSYNTSQHFQRNPPPPVHLPQIAQALPHHNSTWTNSPMVNGWQTPTNDCHHNFHFIPSNPGPEQWQFPHGGTFWNQHV